MKGGAKWVVRRWGWELGVQNRDQAFPVCESGEWEEGRGFKQHGEYNEHSIFGVFTKNKGRELNVVLKTETVFN